MLSSNSMPFTLKPPCEGYHPPELAFFYIYNPDMAKQDEMQQILFSWHHPGLVASSKTHDGHQLRHIGLAQAMSQLSGYCL